MTPTSASPLPPVRTRRGIGLGWILAGIAIAQLGVIGAFVLARPGVLDPVSRVVGR